MKKIFSIVILSLLHSIAVADSGESIERRRFSLTGDLSFNSNSIITKNSDSTLDASTASTFIALELGGDYFYHPKFAATAQVLFTLASSISADINGFDVGVRYYPLNSGYQSESNILGSKIKTTPGLASFIYGGFSSRDYKFSNTSISFQGLELGGGADWHLDHHYFLRGSLTYQLLSNATTRTLNGFATALGLGYSF